MAHGPQYKVSPFIIWLAYVVRRLYTLDGITAQFALALFQCPLQFVIAYALPEKYRTMRDTGVLIVQAANQAGVMDHVDKTIKSRYPAMVNFYVWKGTLCEKGTVTKKNRSAATLGAGAACRSCDTNFLAIQLNWPVQAVDYFYGRP